MKNYIIDPSVFYWMNVMSIVQTVLAVFGAFLLIGFLCFTVAYFCTISYVDEPEKPSSESKYDIERYNREMKNYQSNQKTLNSYKKYMLLTLIIGCAFVMISVFIPSKQTSIEMLVAKTATFDNVNWTVQQVKEVVDYIVSALKGMV